jgi:hypothetical protein
MKHFFFILLLGVLISGKLSGQIETTVLDDSTTYSSKGLGYFFTNRELEINEDSSYTFRNRGTRQTQTLYFCRYDFERDTIFLKYKATSMLPADQYPTDPVNENFFYKMYTDLRLKEGIKNFVIVVPGIGKTFQEQLGSYMIRLQRAYADSAAKTAFILFAWGDQTVVPLSQRAKQSAERAANDFAIFQNMLESFLSDSQFFKDHPDDISFKLVCLSTGSELFRSYLLNRGDQEIALIPAYNRVIFVGSDAPANSFEEGGGFDDLTQMADSVLVLVNRRDRQLDITGSRQSAGSLGAGGPANLSDLPGNIVVKDVTSMMEDKETTASGYDYFLRNRELRHMILYGQLTGETDQDQYKE